MIRICVLLILISLPTIGFAQRVAVKSGEHADFSRLAFEFPGEIEWEMGRVEQGYEIRLKGASAEIDISEVFHRIPRDRIKDLSISEDNTRITLQLDCDCHADAFEFRSGLLVVDVKDGQAQIASSFEKILGSDEPAAASRTQVATTKTPTTIAIENAKDIPEVVLPLRLPKTQSQTNPQNDLFGVNSDTSIQASTEQVSQMQSEILQQIGRAASQGLLNASIPEPVMAEPAEHDVEEVVQRIAPVPASESSVNIHVENSIDREFEGFFRKNLLTDNGGACLEGSLFNISEWGDEDSVLSRVSEQRQKITGEFDKIDPDAVQALVRAYIYAGFGAEAIGVLTSFDVTLDEEKTLTAMAEVVDGLPQKHPASLTQQLACDSTSALWAALSAPSLSKQGPINTVSILGAFSGLPLHLRRLLGPALAQKFVKSGDIETARSIRNAIARAPGNAGPAFQLLDAQLDVERGRDESAEQKLEGIIVSDQGLAPKALIELLEIRLQKGKDIDPKILATAESYIFEQQKSEIAAELAQLVALALGQRGSYMEALSALNELTVYESLDDQKRAKTWEKVVGNLVEKASESELLQFVFAAQDQINHQDLSRQTRRTLAQRLLKEGWLEEAEMVLAAPESPTTDDRIILARIGILGGRTDYGLKILENVAGDAAAKLRALAYRGSGNYLAAAREYAQLKDEENRKLAIWRAKDWDQLEVIGSEVEQAAAKMMMSEGQQANEATSVSVGAIARDRLLLAKSEEERLSIEKLLQEYPVVERDES